MTKYSFNIIIQAGGRGSRLRHHTWNKPKCLVSIRGKPLLYYMFDIFPNSKFFIIGDYAYEQLENYLTINNPKIEYRLIKTQEKGTASGIASALKMIENSSPVILTWSDILIKKVPIWPETEHPVVCTTSAFTCRWSADEDGKLRETASSNRGIAGLFYYKNLEQFKTPPESGEFVKWFAKNVDEYELLNCDDIQELGDFSTIEEANSSAGFCRFFNRVEIQEHTVIKTVVDPDYAEVHRREVAWYTEANGLGFRRIPVIHSTSPLVMERLKGSHAFQMNDLSKRERRAVLCDYLDSLISLHDKSTIPSSKEDIEEVYLNKTITRVERVKHIIPGYDRESVTINGKKCRNVFHGKHRDTLYSVVETLNVESFVPIHGDATFSNTIIDDNLRVWFIDPRGYFAKPGIYGDPYYDFAKIYYSAVGGYDNFNRRKFKLYLDDHTVEIIMDDPAFSDTAGEIFKHYFNRDLTRVEILHALIWFALSGYSLDDIDSIIGAFYFGLYWMESGSSKL